MVKFVDVEGWRGCEESFDFLVGLRGKQIEQVLWGI